MIVTLPAVISRSGSDVYFSLLARELPKRGVAAELVPLSHRHEFVPMLSAAERSALARADVIHTSVEHGSLVHVPGRPLVLTAHHNVLDPAYQRYTGPLQKLFHHLLVHPRQKRSLRLASTVICVSEATRRSYAATYPEFAGKMQVIYHGIDTGHFAPGPKSASGKQPSKKHFSLLFVGHMTRRKGADLLPEIMDRLGPDYLLICAGQRNAGTRSMTTPSGAQIHVRAAVTDDELLRLYQDCNLLLFPSRLEGFGYAVAEAMACGKPVVATDGSSIPESIDKGKGGLLCPVDDAGAFAKAVQQILSDPEKSTAMGIHNRAKAERMFSLDRMIEEHVALYRGCHQRPTALSSSA